MSKSEFRIREDAKAQSLPKGDIPRSQPAVASTALPGEGWERGASNGESNDIQKLGISNDLPRLGRKKT
jgi:hypothetical protein